MKKTQSQKDAVYSLVSPTLPSSRRILSSEGPFLEGYTATVSSLHPRVAIPRDSPNPGPIRNPGNHA